MIQQRMTAAEQLQAVLDYQRRRDVHPLTCRSHSDVILSATIEDAGILMWCPVRSCDYTQRLDGELLRIVLDCPPPSNGRSA